MSWLHREGEFSAACVRCGSPGLACARREVAGVLPNAATRGRSPHARSVEADIVYSCGLMVIYKGLAIISGCFTPLNIKVSTSIARAKRQDRVRKHQGAVISEQ